MLRKFSYLMFILLVLSITTFAQNVKAIVEKGDKSFARKDYEAALTTYLEAIKSNPDDAGIRYKAGC
jgi:hypothetical protein